jgi:nucleoside-diphosphate-sugar epimerase
MQTILGSGGTIGVELAKHLTSYTDKVRLVSRNPERVNDTDQLVAGDLTNANDVMKAVEGSQIVYLTVGLPYSVKAWESMWPEVVKHVIAACKKHNAKLVFFDNIYMYDPGHLDHMDENTPVNPGSKKGKVRAKIAQMILDEVDKGNLTALIARSADFYGPGIEKNGMVREMIFKRFANGKKANWLCSVSYVHSVTYTPDAAKATALLGNTEDAYNQVWHLPTAPDPLTAEEWIETIAGEMDLKSRFRLAPRFLVRVMGLFVPIMKEMVEMLYQYDRDYVFISNKFEKRFDIKPTPYLEGIKSIVQSDYK